MSRKVVTVDVPITYGQREDVDKRVLPDGALTRVKNMRLRKDGRWGVRNDYTAASMLGVDGDDLVACDLANLDNRLMALGRTDATSVTAPTDLFEFVDQDQFAWRQSSYRDGVSNTRLSAVTGVRDMGRYSFAAISVTKVDCAAAGGLVCLVNENTSSTTRVHVFDPVNDSSIVLRSFTGTDARVVSVGSVFFILSVDSGGTKIQLSKYDPASDTDLVTLTDAFAMGDDIVTYDVVANFAGDGFWVAVHRDTPTITIESYSSAGAASGSPVTGPTVASDYISILETENRLRLAIVPSADSVPDLYTYDGATLETGPTQLVLGAATGKQVGLSLGTNNDDLDILVETTATGDIAFHSDVAEDNTLGSTTTKRNLTLQTKPRHVGSVEGRALRLFGGQFVEPDGFYTPFIASLKSEQIHAAKDRFTGGAIAASHLPTLAYDSSTDLYYWPQLIVNEDGTQGVIVSEFSAGKVARRQMVSLGGQLYIAGGALQLFDTRVLIESGMVQAPVLSGLVLSAAAGSLPTSATFSVAVAEEWFDSQGNKHQSPVSNIETVTTDATQNQLALNVDPVHSSRDNISSIPGIVKTIVVYRSEDGTTVLKRAATSTGGGWGVTTAFTLTGNDASIADKEVIYTQDGRAGIGSFLEHEAPQPGKYLTRMGKRLVQAGLPNPYLAQVSKNLSSSEPVNWSSDLAFFLTCPEKITGVASLDTVCFVFSRESVYAFTGDGPEDDGSNEFPGMVKLPSSTGLKDYRSILEVPDGVMFQGDDDKIYLASRGGGAPIWISPPVRDTLLAYPDITAATLARQEQLAVFSCQNDGGTDTRLISLDLRAKVWNVDEFASSTPVAALTNISGRLVRLTSGVVYFEDSTAVPSTFIAHGMTSGVIRPFKDNGWGRLYWFLWVLEFRGNCTVTGKISYDDGVTYTTVKQFTLDTDDYSAGDLVRCQFWPERRKGDRFTLDLQVTSLASAATEGVVIHGLSYGVRGILGGSRQVEQRG